MSKKSALVWNGKKYETMVVDHDIMTKTLVFGRIVYVLNNVRTFPQTDTQQSFGRLTAEKTYVRFTYECSAKVDTTELVRYAVGCDRFGGLPLNFKSHAGKLTITTCLCGTLSGASKFLLKAMHEEYFTLQRVKVEFIDGNGTRQPQTVVWSRKDCEQFQTNTDVTAAVQVLRKAYHNGKL